MKYCDECGSLIIPKKEKTTGEIKIICRKCGAQYPSNPSDIEDYTLSFDVDEAKRDKLNVVKEKLHREKLITSEDREAFEDYFEEISEEDSGTEST
jgi:DNA-directed RNA polymerase subunit M/transcription elongation factor TFIIS